MRSAYSSYLSALADYNEAIEGPTDKEISDAKDKITSAELSLDQAKISLENTKQSAEDKLHDAQTALKNAKEDLEDNQNELTSKDVQTAYKNLVNTIKSINISLSGMLEDSDKIIGVDKENLNDEFESVLSIKDSNYLLEAKNTYVKAKSNLEELEPMAVALSFSSPYSEIDSVSDKLASTLERFEQHLYYMKLVLDATITSIDFTQSELNSFISTISSNRSAINTNITNLNTKEEAVDDAIEGLDDYITAYEDAQRDLENTEIENQRNIDNSQASLTSKELSLEQTKRDYDDLIAPMSESESASARSKLTSASINYEKAKLELEKATITSPIDGEVAMLNYKAGDIIVDNSSSDPVAVIINNDTLFIEVNIEEADINKIKTGQAVKATFDALDELTLSGEVSFISLTSETSANSIVTYLVRVIIDNSGENEIREGMTAFVDFITAETSDVLMAPVQAVRNVNGSPSVQLQSGEWLPVTTGFTDGKYVEVISGVNEGDKIVY